MRRTFMLIIGLAFATMFFGFLIMETRDRLSRDYQIRITDIRSTSQNDTLKVTWSTDTETIGTLYINGTIVRAERYGRFHSLTAKGLDGPIVYYVEACDSSGVCGRSDAMNAVMSAVVCEDGTQNNMCAETKPEMVI